MRILKNGSTSEESITIIEGALQGYKQKKVTLKMFSCYLMQIISFKIDLSYVSL